MRIPSIDTIKVIGILAVIFLHTGPFGDPQYAHSPYRLLALIINQSARFAVPFFFIASGYFFAKSLQKGIPAPELLFKYCRRLLTVFLLWSIIYAVVPRHWVLEMDLHGPISLFSQHILKTLNWVLAHPLDFILQGTRIHLWFLSTLMFSLCLITAFILLGRPTYLIGVSSVAYAVGLLAGSYSHTALGLHLGFNTVPSPLSGTLFVVIGWLLGNARVPAGHRLGYFLMVSGFLLHNLEALYLKLCCNMDVSSHHYLIGTVPFGAGIFLLAHSYPRLGTSTFLPRLGQMTLGVYVSHFLVIDTLSPLSIWFSGPLWELLFPILVYLVAVCLVYLYERIHLSELAFSKTN